MKRAAAFRALVIRDPPAGPVACGIAVIASRCQRQPVVLSPTVPGRGRGDANQRLHSGPVLGFFNRTAFDRWWEGRRLWGQLVNESATWLGSECLRGARSDCPGTSIPFALTGFAEGIETAPAWRRAFARDSCFEKTLRPRACGPPPSPCGTDPQHCGNVVPSRRDRRGNGPWFWTSMRRPPGLCGEPASACAIRHFAGDIRLAVDCDRGSMCCSATVGNIGRVGFPGASPRFFSGVTFFSALCNRRHH